MTALYVVLGVFVFVVIAYLLMIMPRMVGKPDTKPFKNHLYAHRGLFDNESDAPENSMKAFKKAVDAGFGMEMDIQLTKDGQMVVFHDFSLKRMCGVEGKVCEYTFDELQQFSLLKSEEKIPLFTEVLKLVDGKVPLIIEYKIETPDASVCEVGNEILKDYKGVYCIESFNPFGVHWYKKHRKDVVRGQLSEEFLKNGSPKTPVYFIVAKLLTNFWTKPDFIAYNALNYKNWSRRICRNLYGNLAVTWTIKSQEQLDEMRKYFDMFIFDSFVPDPNYMKK
jgi:glycerophosphoryl diester phosphodiesterase